MHGLTYSIDAFFFLSAKGILLFEVQEVIALHVKVITNFS